MPSTTNYIFEDRTAKFLKDVAVQELIKTGKALITNLRNDRDKREIEYDFNDYSSQTNEPILRDNSAYFNDVLPIVNVAFVSTEFIDQSGQIVNVPELENNEPSRFNIELCSIRLSGSKKVVKTELLNESGTIKEIVSTPDKRFTISGVLVGTNDANPIDLLPEDGKPIKEMEQLVEICDANISINIESNYLDKFGIRKCVIESFDFPQETEWKNLQRFTLNCVADDDDLVIL